MSLHVPPFSISDDNGRMQDWPAYSLAGECWAPSLDFSLSCFLQPGPKLAAALFTLYTERMKVRKIIPSAPFIVGETEEMLDCDLPRITQEILGEMGYWLCFCSPTWAL